MSFYGNITSNNKTQFKFETTYTSQEVMQEAAANDGVFVGGYVLLALASEGNNGTDYSVWQKINTDIPEKQTNDDGTEQIIMTPKLTYVHIAELNSVVPSFDIQVDAPTMTPVAPHFDTNSTNAHYLLHWQPQWGLRVAAAESDQSDATTVHCIETYNSQTGQIDKTETEVPAAIYYNAAAFNGQVDVNRTDDSGIIKHAEGENQLTILPTGKSGNKYSNHDGNNGMAEQIDIQEMRINLPAIGNMMSDAWDIIHGPKRNDGPDSLQGQLNFFTTELQSNQIPVSTTAEEGLQGVYLEELKLTQFNKPANEENGLNGGDDENVNADLIKYGDTLSDVFTSVNTTVKSINESLAEQANTIQTVSDNIAQADWTEQDESANSFIRNKPILFETTTKLDYKNDDTIQFNKLENNNSHDSFDVQSLYVKVWQLETRINELEKRIETLEKK